MVRLAAVFFVFALIAALFGIGFALKGRGEDSLLRLPRFRGAVFPGGRIAKASLCGLREECLMIASLTSVHEPASNME
ncbi:MAG: hypothetical protein JO114_00620 [Planctomycetaceae bacterium]|nr:hypothetical protein [Planctomycetaceae bacterium]MBV8309889.1 hypothetical protein [Planctomycetaceae bacterium]